MLLSQTLPDIRQLKEKIPRKDNTKEQKSNSKSKVHRDLFDTLGEDDDPYQIKQKLDKQRLKNQLIKIKQKNDLKLIDEESSYKFSSDSSSNNEQFYQAENQKQFYLKCLDDVGNSDDSSRSLSLQKQVS